MSEAMGIIAAAKAKQGGGSSGESWITEIPEMHRNIFRGQSLGSSVTAAQLAAIEDGSFDDLYVGDYWTINNVVWRIADIDHYLGKGESYQLTAHHLVIMPDTTIDTAAMGTTNYYSARNTILTNAKTAVNAAFPNMVIPYSEVFYYNGSIFADDSEVDIPDVLSVTGNMLMRTDGTVEYTHTMSFQQFALFKLAPEFIVSNAVFWTRNLSNVEGSNFVAIAASGRLGLQWIRDAAGIRPYFLIGVSE